MKGVDVKLPNLMFYNSLVKMEGGTNSIQLHRHYLLMTVRIAQTTEEQIKVGSSNTGLYFV